MTRTRRLGALLLFAGAVAAAACVDIATGPNGITSIRLLPVPPSIIRGDSLRDSTGAVVTLRAVAFDQKGDTVKDVPFRFSGLALAIDTTAAQRAILVTVDSMTGAVAAVDTGVATRARLAVRVGDRLQVLDTITLVKRPTQLTRSEGSDTLRVGFLCSDTGRVSPSTVSLRLSKKDTVAVGNAFPLAVTLTADSTATARSAVPSYYVRFEVTSSSTTIPQVRRAGGPLRPAIGIIADPSSDVTTNTDTTDANGTATAYLRVLPEGIPPASATDTLIDVTVRATARTTPTKPLRDTVVFVVRLRRLLAGAARDTNTFPRDSLTGKGCGR